MRKVQLTKQNVIAPKAIMFGLSIKQIITIIIGVIVAVLTFLLFNILLALDVNVTMTIVFFELLFFASISIVKVNGMTLFRWIYYSMKGPIFRPYISKGMLDTYEKTEEKQKK